MSMLIRKDKKAITAVYWVIYGIVIGLCTFYFFHTFKSLPQNTEYAGQVFLESYKETQNSIKNMYYIKKSAEYSPYNAIYPFVRKGFYFKDTECSAIDAYIMWENIIEDKEVKCYPTESDIKTNFGLFLNQELNRYFDVYTLTIIPKNNYDFTFNEKEGNIEIIGIATRKVITPPNPTEYKNRIVSRLPKEEQDCLSKEGYVSFFTGNRFTDCRKCPEEANCERYINEVYCNIDPCNLGCGWDRECKRKYSVSAITPSFQTEIQYHFITQSASYSAKVQQIRDNIQACLRKGSYTSDDKEDLSTCSDIYAENYQITPIAFPKNYTLLFEIEDPTFENPYSEEKLIIKFGIRFLDTFSPLSTEITGIEEGKLKWNKNNASDIVSYSIYARALEPTYINENDLITKVESVTEWEIDYENTILKQGEKYYFYVIAEDNAGNKAEGILPKELTI